MMPGLMSGQTVESMMIHLDPPEWNQELSKALSFLRSSPGIQKFSPDVFMPSCESMRANVSYGPILRFIEAYWDAKAHGFSNPGNGMSFTKAEHIPDELNRLSESKESFSMTLPDAVS